MSTLAETFHQEMINTYHEAAKIGYRATYFLQMVQQHGGLATARLLLAKPVSSAGFERLWELGRLDISLEAIVLKPAYADLFDDVERQIARERLKALGYTAPWDYTQKG